MSSNILSLVVPAYNAAETLPACLESVRTALADCGDACEVVVVNDGSTDATGAIAADYAARFPQIFRVLAKANGHYGSCVNAALPTVRGRYVKLLDADDTVDAAGLRQLLAELDGQPADLVVTGFRTVTPSGEVLSEQLPSNTSRHTVHMVVYARDLLLRMNYRQIEGLPYTDTQWILEPMAGVRCPRVVPRIVTNYTFGREGQSMADETFARSFDKMLTVVVRLIEHYPAVVAQSTQQGRAYYTHHLRRHIRWCLHLVVSGYRGQRVTADLTPLDRALAHHPALFSPSARLMRLACRVFGPTAASKKRS